METGAERRMTINTLLIANRGEVAIRIARAAAGLGMRSVAVFSADEAGALHTSHADQAISLGVEGPAAYLDIEHIVALALETNCQAIHPGYGFLSESAALAERCAEAGLVFVGPAADALALLGDKTECRALAARCGIPVPPGTDGPADLAAMQAFRDSLDGDALMIKAVAGGGGRGMRVVEAGDDLDAAYQRCAGEARNAFADDRLYGEAVLSGVRHIEVQILGDGNEVIHLGERECSIQRQRQKLLEMAPCPGLGEALRERLCDAAVRLGQAVGYRGLGTCEFLVEASLGLDAACHFIEANARLQVEHTVTEQVTGLDLVAAQLRIAAGDSLATLGLERPPARRGMALQARVNLERLTADGTARPSAGSVSVFEPPTGPGVRVDGCGYAGYRANPNFDSLLAKVIAWADGEDLGAAASRLYRALSEFRIEGVETNRALLMSLLRDEAFLAGDIDTRFLEENIADLLATPEDAHPRRHLKTAAASAGVGARVDANDPLAVLEHGKSASEAQPTAMPGAVVVPAPMQGTIVAVAAADGDLLRDGEEFLILEAMKMQHAVSAPVAGLLSAILVAAGDTVAEGQPLAFLEPQDVAGDDEAAEQDIDLDAIRPDLAEVQARHALGHDEARPEAVARRRKTGQRTARENLADLVDEDSFIEYGPLIIAAQRSRRSLDDLIARTPADGLIGGIGTVNATEFPDGDARCIVMSYDYTVLAGTQGFKNHEKKDRMFELAEQWRLPLVLFAEGGGGRPGDTDWVTPAGLHVMAFHYFARLSGLVPLVGIVSGRCFAGNAALLGCCDVVIATANATLGMGGPAMIEGGALGVYRPEEVGPMAVQRPNGVVDIAVADEAEAVAAAKRYLSYFQGRLADWTAPDQRLLRRAVPENRLRIYDVRNVIDTLADEGSVLELRRDFGLGMVTALIRLEGRPVGLVANNPTHLAGAIDSDGADKVARFLQLCDAHDLPVVTLIDTPGMMVGPEVEKTALVRHCCRLFVIGANLEVPMFSIILRKAYGLGAQAMAGGSFKTPFFTVAWPSGEFGGMGLEGAVKLGFRKELEAVEDAAERKALFEQMVAKAYEDGKALNTATYMEFDDVIDPAETRRWLLAGLASLPPKPARTAKRRPNVDTW